MATNNIANGEVNKDQTQNATVVLCEQSSNSATSASAEEIFSDVTEIFNDGTEQLYQFNIPIKCEILHKIESLSADTFEKRSFKKWENKYLSTIEDREIDANWFNPKTGLCYKCGAKNHVAHCTYFTYHLFQNVSTICQGNVMLDPLIDEEDGMHFDFKESTKKNKERRFEKDVRYKNKARAGKIAKGPVQVLEDRDLYDFLKIPFKQIESWFPIGFTKNTKNGRVYEQYRRVCRYYYITNNWFFLTLLGNRHGFVDVRDHKLVPKKQAIGKTFRVIYNGQPISLEAQMMGVAGLSNLVEPAKNFVASAYNAVTRLPTTINIAEKTLESHERTINGVETLFTRLNGGLDSIYGVVDQLKTMFRQMGQFTKDNAAYVYTLILDLGLLLSQVLLSSYQSAPCIAMFVGKYFGYDKTFDAFGKAIMTIVDGVKGSNPLVAQSGLELVPHLASTASVFGVLLGLVLRKETFDVSSAMKLVGDTSLWANRVFVQGRAAYASITDMFEGYFDEVLVWLGYGPVSPLGALQNDVTKFLEYVAKIKSAEALGRVYGDKILLSEVERQIKIGNELLESLVSVKEKVNVLLLTRGVAYLEGWLKVYAGATAALIGVRQRPTCVMLQGRAGVGKSIFANIVADDILEQVYGLNRHDPDYAEERMRYVWEYRSDVNDKDAYFNGLTKNHKVMIWSEAFQKKDRPLDPSRDVQTLMACVDSAGYAPPQAFESKGKIPYEIPFIIITTNVKGHIMVDNQNWTSPHAINRRFDFIYWCVTSKKCLNPITKELDISHIEKDPDALCFHRVRLIKDKNSTDNELPISYRVDIEPTKYANIVEDILECDANYNAIFEKLRTITPACSKTLNFAGKYLKIQKPLEAQMMKVPIVEVGSSKFDLLNVPVHKLELLKGCNSVNCSVLDLSTTTMMNLLNHLSSFGAGKCVELILDFPVGKFRFNRIKISRASDYLLFTCDERSLVLQVNAKSIKVMCRPGSALRTRFCKFEENFVAAFPSFVDKQRAVQFLWLLDEIQNSVGNDVATVFEVVSSTCKKKYYDRFKDYLAARFKAIDMRWLAGVVAGVFGVLGVAATYYFTRPSMKDTTPSITYKPVAYPLEFESAKTENVPRTAKHVRQVAQKILHTQSSKVENVPRTAKATRVLFNNPMHMQSVDLEECLTTHKKKFDRKSMMEPMFVKAAIEKIENMITNAKEGELHTIDGDYKEFVAQDTAGMSVRADPDGHAIRALIWQNTVSLFLVNDDGKPYARIGNALFVTNNVALMPKHYQLNLKTGVRFCFYRMQGKKQWEGTIDECVVRLAAEGHDLMSVKFPNTVCFPTILKHIVKEEDAKRFTAIPAVLTTVAPQILQRDGKEMITLFIKEFHITRVFANDEIIEYSRGDVKLCNRLSYEYNCATEYGDCGAALVAIARDMPRKILGIHVAGNGQYCISAAFTRELVDSLLPLNAQDGVLLAHHEVCPCICSDGCKLCGGSKLVCEIKDMYHGFTWFKDEDSNFIVGNLNHFQGVGFNMGKSMYSGKHSTTMIIEPSPLQGVVPWKAVKLPAMIVDHTLPDGSVCHVKQEAFKKLIADYKYMDPKLVDECVADAMKCLYDIPDWFKYCRVLTIDEAIFGVEPTDPYLGCIKSLNLNSSCGKVWERLKKGAKVGKRSWIDLDTRWVDPFFRQAVELQMAEWEQGIRRLDPFSMECKSELRKPPKHLVPRMYNSGDMVSLVNTKRLFAGVVALIQQHWLSTGVTVGMNCHVDFRVLCKKLQSRGLRVFDGDFKNFDGKLPVQFMERVMFYLICFNKNGGYTDANIRACHTADNSIRFAMLVALGMLLLMSRGNPSGNFLTTQLNSFCVKGALRYVWMILTKGTKYHSMQAYNEHVVEVANGDDNVVNVSADASVFFNQVTVSEVFNNHVGMEYTDASKTGVMTPFKMINEITYLKRTMTVSEAGALDLESILESVLWLKRGVSSYDAFDCTLSSALMEMFHHGEEKFVWFRNELEKAMFGTSLNRIRLKTYPRVYEDYVITHGVGFGFTY